MSEIGANLTKNGYRFSIPIERLTAYSRETPRDTSDEDRIGYWKKVPPTQQEWDDYSRAVQLLRKLEQNPCYHPGYDGPGIMKPRPTRVWVDDPSGERKGPPALTFRDLMNANRIANDELLASQYHEYLNAQKESDDDNE